MKTTEPVKVIPRMRRGKSYADIRQWLQTSPIARPYFQAAYEAGYNEAVKLIKGRR